MSRCRLLVPAAAALVRSPRAPRPTPLRVDDHPVDVEDDGFHRHTCAVACGRRRGASAAPPLSTELHFADEERVVAGRGHLDRAGRSSQPARRRAARAVVAHLDAVPERDRRHAAPRELLRQVLLLAARTETAHVRRRAAARAATLCARSRCPRAAGPARARRATRPCSPCLCPSTSATTTETPAGQRRKSDRCSSPSSTRGEPRRGLPQFGLAGGRRAADLVVRGRGRASRSYAPARALPDHVGVTPGPMIVARYFVPLPAGWRAVRDDAVTEGARRVVREEAVLALPARAVRRVERVDVEVAAEGVERLPAGVEWKP